MWVLEIDWDAYVFEALSNAVEILNSTAVITVNYPFGITYVRHIDWLSLANIYIDTKKMRNKCTNFLDKVDDKIPGPGERPRPGMTQDHIDYYENLSNEGYRLLEMGDAKLRAFNWDSIINNPIVPTQEQAVEILLRISEYQTMV